ncbi:hypothetical protein QCA50_012344 [Cerrena zonata]|uniref:Uncharacterized protein n=1 Tax=Cerrena zonata TaxID=2478898 RepID=A0AAW0FW50_9APHY
MSSRRYGTRASNVNKHPGQIVLDNMQTRRGKNELAIEKAAIAAKEQEKTLATATKIKKLSKVQRQEERAAKKASQAEVSAATQRPKAPRSNPKSTAKVVTMVSPPDVLEKSVSQSKRPKKVGCSQIEEYLAREASVFELSSDSDPEREALLALSRGLKNSKRALDSDSDSDVVEVQPSKKAKPSQHGFREGWKPHRDSPPIKVEKVDVRVDAPTYGGYVEDDDDDDAVEGSAAAHDGVAARKVVNNTKSLATVKFKPAVITQPNVTTLASTEIPRAPRRPNGSKTPVMTNLPLDISRTIWTKHFIPSCFDILGEHTDPFILLGEDIIQQIATVFHVCFPDLKHEVTVDSVIFAVLSQRCCEHRSKIGSIALDNVTELLNTTPGLETTQSRAAYVKEQKAGSLYFYRETNPLRRGVFRSDLILKAFSHHLSAIEGTVRVSPFSAIGALGLAATAVQRAFFVYQNGVLAATDRRDDNPVMFSATNWRQECDHLIRSISALGDDPWSEVYERATQLNKKLNKASNANNLDDTSTLPAQHERALIADD